MATHEFQAPTGTRDFYPVEMLRRRFIEKAWRDASVRHGFDEIDGPTFEHTTLYTVKSGEGILSELFSFTREGGEKAYALRPEFTPTLARMYAARAGQLSKPTRWFWQQSCFRAERPQKGRLREFLQWNCDLIGGDGSAEQAAAADAEIIATCVGLLSSLGLTPADVQVRYNHRASLGGIVSACGVAEKDMEAALVLLDRREKLDNAELEAKAFEFGLGRGELPGFYEFLTRARKRATLAEELGGLAAGVTLSAEQRAAIVRPLELLEAELSRAGVREWCVFDLNVARGLAYYTGMVFEVHEVSGGQRAVAGGGRYDKLIELFGGPSTPAVGFGMGDVVLSLVLEDRKKFPEGRALLEELSEPGASLRPDAFVLSNGSAEADAAVKPLVAKLRAAGLHARVSGKATKNIGKLLQEASGCFSRYAVIVESADEATVKNLDTQAQERLAIGEVVGRVSRAG